MNPYIYIYIIINLNIIKKVMVSCVRVSEKKESNRVFLRPGLQHKKNEGRLLEKSEITKGLYNL